ncbi:MAG TPA: S-methyl-5-thioribose-1-phosphate isomerase [Magnetospirillaceae bacterium]|nr:S-methyl-5-thioribose-1-phosphate isomerase [Magnetospirillaceae bacterium]
MDRGDDGLAFLLKYENVAWYEDGRVRILDRRVYPARTEYVTCLSHGEVAAAIRDMVTQSAGPYTAAAMGMVLAAREAGASSARDLIAYMEKAARLLSNARPTTSRKMTAVTSSCLAAARDALDCGEDLEAAVFRRAVAQLDDRYAESSRTARYLVDKFPDGGTVLTQCFGETIVGTMLRECRNRGREVKVICAETRPYFQGARLTASVAREMGFDVTVITDNMPGHTLAAKNVDVFTSAADIICLEGHIVNKVGTFQIALASQYWGVPYYVTGSPDPQHPTVDTVRIEERDGEETLAAMGIRTAMEGVKGYYPAFDITPPKLCSGVVTDRGVFPPLDLGRYFEGGAE